MVIEGGSALRGRIRPPGDKSISHRALLLAARAAGPSSLRGLSTGEDVARTAAAVRALGAGVEAVGEDGETRVTGGHLGEPEEVIDVGNSGTGMRLLAGLVAAYPWLTVIQGDRSVSRRPMARVVEPLGLMGARIDGRREGRLPPLVVRGGALHGIDYTPPVASAQVKGAVLLAGLGADGETVVREPVTTRAHTEEMLTALGADITVEAEGPGRVVRLRPGPLEPFEVDIPGDPSQAAFWLVAACITPGSEVVVEGVYDGPARGGFLGVLARMGADVEVVQRRGRTVDIVARSGPLVATDVGGDEVPGLIDEIPVLAVAAARAEGTTTFRDAAELAVKESNRVESLVACLGALGVEAEARPDGLVVHGPGAFEDARVDARGDHRMAMAMAVAGLAGTARVEVSGWDVVATSYPGFEADLASLRGQG
jgi:3-phosphoshikimate 1-carboxyvinyltransferase